MRLGVDFGTTRIVVAAVDRGNYPILAFESPEGEAVDWFPPIVAVRGDERRYGCAAWAAAGEPGWTLVRSIKRALDVAGPETPVRIGDGTMPMLRLLVEMAAALGAAIRESAGASAGPAEPLEVMLGVPANANGNQRFLTVEAFRRAGFDVLGLLNEPSAAGIEFGHGRREPGRPPGRILVYDLGGGTFDASLVEIGETEHDVIASAGISTLGGDDFDLALAEIALEAAGVSEAEFADLEQDALFRLLEECRRRKEALHANSRALVVDLALARDGWGEVRIPVAAFYDRCRPAVEETLHAVEDLLSERGEAPPDVAYLTGGGSELPLVSRMLRERFGRRLRRSAHTRAATAIGLAIRADALSGYALRERFGRTFGVWREADGGRRRALDPLFARGTPLPARGEPPLERTRRYHPVHNVGHFRYLECSRLDGDVPAGDVTVWDEIRFPLDPELRDAALESVEVVRSARAEEGEVEERYACDADGIVHVTITHVTAGYARTFPLARWAAGAEPVVPGKPRRRAPTGRTRRSK
jgi:molecular chaperone DnaK (HSP70)